jgi:hypothetical protein
LLLARSAKQSQALRITCEIDWQELGLPLEKVRDSIHALRKHAWRLEL